MTNKIKKIAKIAQKFYSIVLTGWFST